MTKANLFYIYIEAVEIPRTYKKKSDRTTCMFKN